MANRTIQFWGQGYAPTGTDPIVITATLSGNVIYTGNIPTLYTFDIGRLPGDQVVLFTCELPIDFAGTVPMSISLDSPVGVDVYFEQITSNYMSIINPVYTPSEINVLTINPTSVSAEKIAIYTAKAVPPLSSDDIAVLENGTREEKNPILVAHNLTVHVSSGPDTFISVVNNLADPRSNVAINGTAVTRGDTPAGTWGWEVGFSGEGSGLIEYDLTVIAGLA
jgi:hypothetical protein